MTKEILCPICKKPLGESAQYFPFCNERCKLLDLGAWASGKYTIQGSEAEAEDSIDIESEENH